MLTIKEPDDDTGEGRTIIVYDALTGRPRWSSDPGMHLLGAGPDGLVAAAYPSSNPLDPGSVEIRYFPPQPCVLLHRRPCPVQLMRLGQQVEQEHQRVAGRFERR